MDVKSAQHPVQFVYSNGTSGCPDPDPNIPMFFVVSNIVLSAFWSGEKKQDYSIIYKLPIQVRFIMLRFR